MVVFSPKILSDLGVKTNHINTLLGNLVKLLVSSEAFYLCTTQSFSERYTRYDLSGVNFINDEISLLAGLTNTITILQKILLKKKK